MVVTVRCPAKINTFLSVGPPDIRRYHPIRTIFQAVGLYDELVVSTDADQTKIECTGMDLPAENTLTKTLRLVKEAVDLPPLHVKLIKQIPSQSGLGGGSSDAAGLLRALATIVGTFPWDHATTVAEAVGADVPFFLVGGRARATGYGQELVPLDDSEPRWLVISKPEVGVDTAGAYAQLDQHERAWLDFPTDSDATYNDFERVAPCECSDLIERLRSLGSTSAGLSGSGSAVFGFFESKTSAEDAAEDMRRFAASWTVPTLTRRESQWISSS
ncbi:MAG: hypothetical protein JST40_14270 [Armatimonadetes bacterium]|nr:hypothetical protein [Armatimonadota bacterium]